MDERPDLPSCRGSIASEERAASPAHGVPQFPFNSQLVRPLSAAPDLLPASPSNAHPGSDDASPTTFIDASVLPGMIRLMDLIDHFGSHTNAAFPILHVPTVRKLAEAAVKGERIKTAHACLIYRGSPKRSETAYDKLRSRYRAVRSPSEHLSLRTVLCDRMVR